MKTKIKYKTLDEAVKVWDFLSKLENDEKLKLAGSKDFWLEFLSGNLIDIFKSMSYI